MLFGRPREQTVVIIGYPNHGKTVFLAGMFWDSFFGLSESFEDARRPFSVRAVNAKAGESFFGNAITLSRGGLPPSSPRTPPEPAILEFCNVPNREGRRQNVRLTFYDIPGEAVADEEWLVNNAPFLPRTDHILFLFDPTRADFLERALQAADLRDKIYRLVPNGDRKNFIVMLSKMDELRHEDEWADMVAEYWPDSCPKPEQLPHYLDQMEKLSTLLRDWWVSPVNGGRGFVNRVPRSTRFCALSSLGHQPVWDCPACSTVQDDQRSICGDCGAERPYGAPLRLARKPVPFRVRDPLFWIFRSAGVM
jgi:hypothetical protein